MTEPDTATKILSGMNLCCPSHGHTLKLSRLAGAYDCPKGCSFPVLNNIPRFVSSDDYASSFGLQWKEFRLVQLDSVTGTTVSRDRLTRLVGGSLDIFRGKQVLEAGCGAGRFTEVMLDAGAAVHAVDLSAAVEANYENFKGRSNYSVCQADILRLPFASEQFDIVLAIGVIQHTENPERTIEALCSHVKPGRLLVIDHYTYGYAITPSRRFIRSLLVKTRDKARALRLCQGARGHALACARFLMESSETVLSLAKHVPSAVTRRRLS